MVTTKRLGLGVVFLVAVASATVSSGASAATLAPAARAELTKQVVADKAANPEAFAAVAAVRAQVPELDAHKRGPLAVLAPKFVALGKPAVLPLLELVALEGASPGADLTETARRALRLSAVEALGKLRDDRALPVLLALLDGTEDDPDMVKALASAVGRAGTDGAAARLVAAFAKAPMGSPRRAALAAGMGECRRRVVVDALARALGAEANPPADASGLASEVQLAMVGSLGRAANAWAWKTPQVQTAAPGEEGAVRVAAAEALLRAYASGTRELRGRVVEELRVVDAPETKAIMARLRAEAVRAGAGDQVRALDELK